MSLRHSVASDKSTDAQSIATEGNALEQDNIILFDGVCHLCISSIQFIIRHDRRAVFRFLSIQTDLGRELYSKAGLDPDKFDTLILLMGGQALLRSDAALAIVKQLDGPWRMLLLFRIVPRPLRDWVYRLIAKNRYRWFGRQEICMVPTDEVRQRFLA